MKSSVGLLQPNFLSSLNVSKTMRHFDHTSMISRLFVKIGTADSDCSHKLSSSDVRGGDLSIWRGIQ
jgi:hypothetical protein